MTERCAAQTYPRVKLRSPPDIIRHIAGKLMLYTLYFGIKQSILLIMDIDLVTSRLRSGIQRLISDASTPCNTVLSKNYHCSVHDKREFLFAIDGTCNYMCNHSVYPCTPGTMILFNAGVPHGHEYIRHDHGLIHVWGHLSNQKLHMDLLEVPVNGQRRDIPNMDNIAISDDFRDILEKRWNLLCQQPVITEKTVAEYMNAPLEMVLDELAFIISRNLIYKPAVSFSSRVREYITSRNGRACSLGVLAQVFNCTPSYLSSKFHSESGVTVSEFITRTRLHYVRSAMRKNIKQKEIAYALGFSSPASFWNWLNKHREKLENSNL